jgi:cytochrome c oxidase subunit IV
LTSAHVVPVKVYVGVFLALIALTALTTGVAFIDLGPLNTVAALAIAVAKMLLVALFFMHLKYGHGLTRIVVLAGFFWLAILIALTLSDELTRNWTPNPGSWGSGSLTLRSRTGPRYYLAASLLGSQRPCLSIGLRRRIVWPPSDSSTRNTIKQTIRANGTPEG